MPFIPVRVPPLIRMVQLRLPLNPLQRQGESRDKDSSGKK